ncbi:Decaprenyl diphosphate synthase-like protein [Gautieria morchelliformis]|nr:Decaprenyl diphosphate synthase-like protein [Gautieria morchelliformis]
MFVPGRGLQWLFHIVLDLVQRLLLWILASGPVPNHIAFVMDGNRRYARSKGKPIRDGHYAGYSALYRILEVCFRLRIRAVTVYAFAIENFNRPPDEVDALMDLCKEKLTELCEQGELLAKHGVRLNVLGKTSLLPQHVKDAIKKAETMTRHHNRRAVLLNVMMAYSSRDEITTAVQSTVRKALDQNLPAHDIIEDSIDAELYTTLAGNVPVDIFVRTSGVKRFSDFLTWQACTLLRLPPFCCEATQVHFTPTYWPELGLRDFVPILLDYQRKVWSRRFLLAP